MSATQTWFGPSRILWAGEVWEDRTVVITVAGCHEPLAALGPQAMFAHQTADLLGIDDYAAIAQLGADPAIPVGFELITDRDHGRDQRGVVSPQCATSQ